jgi:hypothetical protein
MPVRLGQDWALDQAFTNSALCTALESSSRQRTETERKLSLKNYPRNTGAGEILEEYKERYQIDTGQVQSLFFREGPGAIAVELLPIHTSSCPRFLRGGCTSSEVGFKMAPMTSVTLPIFWSSRAVKLRWPLAKGATYSWRSRGVFRLCPAPSRCSEFERFFVYTVRSLRKVQLLTISSGHSRTSLIISKRISDNTPVAHSRRFSCQHG